MIDSHSRTRASSATKANSDRSSASSQVPLVSPSLPIKSRFCEGGIEQAALWFRVGTRSRDLSSEALKCDSLVSEMLRGALTEHHGALRKWLDSRGATRFLVLLVFPIQIVGKDIVRKTLKGAIKGLTPATDFTSGGQSDFRLALCEGIEVAKAQRWLTKNIKAAQSCPMTRSPSEERPQTQSLQQIKSLAEAAIYVPQSSEIERLTNLIRFHQENIPEGAQDKKELVDSVNKWLDACAYRICLPSGKLARLCVRPGGSGKLTIQFELIGVGPLGGFHNTPIDLVPYRRGDAARILRRFRK